MYWGPEQAISYCAANVQNADSPGHVDIVSGTYYMINGEWDGTGLQAGWRYCSHCKVLYWGGQWANSWCPYWIIQNEIGNTSDTNTHATGNTVYYLYMT